MDGGPGRGRHPSSIMRPLATLTSARSLRNLSTSRNTMYTDQRLKKIKNFLRFIYGPLTPFYPRCEMVSFCQSRVRRKESLTCVTISDSKKSLTSEKLQVSSPHMFIPSLTFLFSPQIYPLKPFFL